MLIAAVTLLPGGDPDRAEAIGLISIANVTPHREVCDYEAWDEYGNRVEIKDHFRADGYLPLLARACEALNDAR